MTTEEQAIDPVEIEESFNDDDWYIINSKTKKVVKRLGKVKVGFMQDPSSVPQIKQHLTSPDFVAMKGMKAKHEKLISENHDHVALLKHAQKGHMRALRKGNSVLAQHYAKRMAFHTRYVK